MSTDAQIPIGFLLVDVARLLRARIDRAYESAGLGLTAGEARALAYARQYPGSRQSALAERMNVEPMTLVGFLDRLEARGLVRRAQDPADRRAKIVELTEEGLALAARVVALARAERERAQEGLSRRDVEALGRALAVMRANLSRDLAQERA
ncbi:MAG TPA: MarR family transcriptional regulator [Sandaracinaceae bacterium]